MEMLKAFIHMQGYLFFEVNDVNPLNTLSFQFENGKLLWDVVVLFAANINYDAEAILCTVIHENDIIGVARIVEFGIIVGISISSTAFILETSNGVFIRSENETELGGCIFYKE